MFNNLAKGIKFSIESRWLLSSIVLVVFGMTIGCSGLPKQYGFSEVQELASTRIGKRVQWIQGTAEDAAVAEAIRALLKEPLTVEAAVQIALLNNPSLQAAYERLGIAQADLVQAGLLQNPVFSGSIGFSSVPTEMEFALLQDLLSLLTLPERKGIQLAAFEQTKHEVAKQVFDLAAQTRTAYYTLVGDEQVLELIQTTAKATEAAAELAQRQYQAGTLSRLEQTAHQTFYAQNLLEVARTEARIRRNREKLTRLMGLWGPDTAWKLPARLPEVPESLPNLTHLEARAIERSLSLSAARQEVKVIASTLELTRRYRLLSMLGLGFHMHREPDGRFVGPNLELTLPLFDQGQGHIARLQAQLRQSQKRLSRLAINLRSKVREARDKLVTAHEHLKYYRDVLMPLRQTALAETQLRYHAMLTGAYELLAAKQNEINTAREYITAMRDFWLAWSELERVLGERIPVPAIQSGAIKVTRPAPVKTPLARASLAKNRYDHAP